MDILFHALPAPTDMPQLVAENNHIRPQLFHRLGNGREGILYRLCQLSGRSFQLPQQDVVCLDLSIDFAAVRDDPLALQRLRCYALVDGGNLVNSYTDIVDYDGTASGTTIYKLDKENTLIASEYDAFLTEIANPDVEADPFAYTSAYVLKGIIPIADDEIPVKMVSMQSPITKLKQKFQLLHPSGRFSQITHPILTLRTSVDVVIIGDTIYF